MGTITLKQNIKWLKDINGNIIEVYHVIEPFNFEGYLYWLDYKISNEVKSVDVEILREAGYIFIKDGKPTKVQDIRSYEILLVNPEAEQLRADAKELISKLPSLYLVSVFDNYRDAVKHGFTYQRKRYLRNEYFSALYILYAGQHFNNTEFLNRYNDFCRYAEDNGVSNVRGQKSKHERACDLAYKELKDFINE